MVGHVHSIETFGTVDGPGVRFVLFLQGCPMRCMYCHNPDTWNPEGGTLMSTDAVLDEYERTKNFYQNGGLTVTGGEPLLQPEFVLELFLKAKKKGISTCLDTSGICYDESNINLTQKIHQILKYTDLVMLDLKQMNEKKHLALTGHSNRNILAFAHYISESDILLRIRHVIVPGITDDTESLYALADFIGTLKPLEQLELLPYHTLGVYKYEKIGIPYRLDGVSSLTDTELNRVETLIHNRLQNKT